MGLITASIVSHAELELRADTFDTYADDYGDALSKSLIRRECTPPSRHRPHRDSKGAHVSKCCDGMILVVVGRS
jgi:hypothetical protein